MDSPEPSWPAKPNADAALGEVCYLEYTGDGLLLVVAHGDEATFYSDEMTRPFAIACFSLLLVFLMGGTIDQLQWRRERSSSIPRACVG